MGTIFVSIIAITMLLILKSKFKKLIKAIAEASNEELKELQKSLKEFINNDFK